MTTMSLYVGVGCASPAGPACASVFSSARSSTQRSMSTSALSAKSGIVALDSAILRAIVCCVRDSSTVVVSPFARATASRLAAWLAGAWLAGACPPVPCATAAAPMPPAPAPAPAPAAAPRAPAPSTSAFTMRPPGPLPASVLRSMPPSRAILRASGEAFTRSSPGGGPLVRTAPVAAPSGAARSTLSACGAAAANPSAGPSRAGRCTPSAAATPTRAMSSPTGSVAPSCARISSTPSWSDSYVIAALSVSISTSSEPRATCSPSRASQRRIVPSSIVSDRRGITMSPIS